jgi:hypothetical protein
MRITADKHEALVKQGIQERKAFKEENHICPVCGGDDLLPCGGPGSYWIEHCCGVYSDISPTLKEALGSNWHQISQELNDCTYPPVGGKRCDQE